MKIRIRMYALVAGGTLLGFATSQGQTQWDRFYVKADVGGNWTRDTSLKEFFGETLSPGAKVKFNPGGRFGLDDDGQTPNTQATTFTYSDGSILTFEVRNLGSFNEGGAGNCANSFFGTKGFYVRDKGFFEYKEIDKGEHASIPVPDGAPKPEKRSKWQRFFAAIRSRDPKDLPMSPLACGRRARPGLALLAHRSPTDRNG